MNTNDVYKPWKLFNAINNNDLDKIELLLKNQNVNLNYRYYYPTLGIRKFTPLMLAIQNLSPEIVSRLLNESPNKLDRNISDLDGNSAILWVILLGHYENDDRIQEILKLLLNDPYVDKNYVKPSNKTDLMKCALWVENMNTIETLLDYHVHVRLDNLDQNRIDWYNEIVQNYYSPYTPKGKGYLKLLHKYQKSST